MAKFDPSVTLTSAQFDELIYEAYDHALEYLRHRGVQIPEELLWKNFPQESDAVGNFYSYASTWSELIDDAQGAQQEYEDTVNALQGQVRKLFLEIEDPDRDRLEALAKAKQLEAEAARLQKQAAHLKNSALR